MRGGKHSRSLRELALFRRGHDTIIINLRAEKKKKLHRREHSTVSPDSPISVDKLEPAVAEQLWLSVTD
jgi:hypothetical protein